MTNSIIPIVTKVNPEDDHLNIETIRQDLEEVMSQNLDLYLRELQSLKSEGNVNKSDAEKEIVVTD